MPTPIVIGGKRVGRFRAGIILFREAFRFLWADAEILFVPLIALFFQAFLVAVVALVLSGTGFIETIESESAPADPSAYAYIFVWYVINAFVLAWTQAAIAHIVSVRAHGGNATLGDGMSVAFKNWSALLLWSIITSTVGIIVRTVAERSQLFVRILVALLGAAWSVLTYFVVPSIIIGKRSAFEAIQDSSSVFKRTWGETLVTNISFSFVFVLAFIAYVVALIGLLFMFGAGLASVGMVLILLVLGIVVFSLLGSVLGGTLRTLLYMYASEGTVPQNFNKELLEQMLVRKTSVAVPQGGGTNFVP